MRKITLKGCFPEDHDEASKDLPNDAFERWLEAREARVLHAPWHQRFWYNLRRWVLIPWADEVGRLLGRGSIDVFGDDPHLWAVALIAPLLAVLSLIVAVGALLFRLAAFACGYYGRLRAAALAKHGLDPRRISPEWLNAMTYGLPTDDRINYPHCPRA